LQSDILQISLLVYAALQAIPMLDWGVRRRRRISVMSLIAVTIFSYRRPIEEKGSQTKSMRRLSIIMKEGV